MQWLFRVHCNLHPRRWGYCCSLSVSPSIRYQGARVERLFCPLLLGDPRIERLQLGVGLLLVDGFWVAC